MLPDNSVQSSRHQLLCGPGLPSPPLSECATIREVGGSRCIHGQLEKVALHLPVSSFSDITSVVVPSPAVTLWKRAAYCCTVGGPIMVQSVTTLSDGVPPPTPSAGSVSGAEASAWGGTMSLCLDFLMQTLCWSFIPQVVVDVTDDHWGSSCKQYESFWTAFQCFLVWWPLTYIFKDIVFSVPLSSFPRESFQAMPQFGILRSSQGLPQLWVRVHS